METWKQTGIPLHIVLRGIERAFHSHETKKRKRSVKSLLYCQEEIEAQYAEWLESRVGANPNTTAEIDTDKTPFTRLEFENTCRSLRRSSSTWLLFADGNGSDSFSEALSRASQLLKDLQQTSIQTLTQTPESWKTH
jgi:hypothetical protein